MHAADENQQTPPRRRRTARRIGVALLVGLAAVLFVAWLARVPIATRFIDRELAVSGVSARYRVADLGFGRQRLTDVVIGDPSRPDLVADWIETQTDIGSDGPRISGVRAGRVRMRARLVDGRLSLGAIDRLLPAPSGAPFALPAIALSVEDGRMRLETPAGLIGLRLSGQGRLDDGFRGRVAAVAPRIAAGGCRAQDMAIVGAVRIVRGSPGYTGPARAARLNCGTTQVAAPALAVDATLGPRLDRWQGEVRGRAGAVEVAGVGRLGDVAGTLTFAGDRQRTGGSIAAKAGVLATLDLSAGTADARLAYLWRDGRLTLDGTVAGERLALTRAHRERLRALGSAAAGTPVAPLAARLGAAAAAAAGDLSLSARISGQFAGAGGTIRVAQASARAATGFAASLTGVQFRWPDGGMRIEDGRLEAGGGGFPALAGRLRQAGPGAPLVGAVALRAPYAADGARLALTPVAFSIADGSGRATTRATLSGPLGDGRVERLTLPLDLRWSGGRLRLNPACTSLAFDRLAVAGLVLRPARLGMCPTGSAMVTLADGRLGGGARIERPRLAGTLGGSALALAAARAEVGASGLALAGVAARLGSGERVTRIDAARITGTFARGGIGGTFAGAAGQIGNVPLLMSEGAGTWRFANGALRLEGGIMVADAAEAQRFLPLAGRGVSLRLADGAIDVGGALHHPGKGVKVADVTIRHVLASGEGAARLAVPGITFGDGFQPEELTRLTFGVIADVRGTVSGVGDIAWTPDGVRSTGTFRTPGTDLAAAFGPVTGLTGEIRFTDLLALESAPGQVASVASINPGVPVTDGRVVYQTLPDLKVAVEGARWPFAGGTLTLDPTLLDFSDRAARRLTFRVEGMQAAQFLQQFEFENINATGVFDGVLPMVFDATGGRIEDGRLTVREGGGTLAHVGELTQEDLGTWGNIAFQALRSLRYRSLDVVMNGPLAGEMITEVRFAGISQGEGAKSNFLIRRLQRLPFVFNIRIKAPFRGLIDSAASFYDPNRLIERNLPALIEEQNRRAAPTGVQPPASENRP